RLAAVLPSIQSPGIYACVPAHRRDLRARAPAGQGLRETAVAAERNEGRWRDRSRDGSSGAAEAVLQPGSLRAGASRRPAGRSPGVARGTVVGTPRNAAARYGTCAVAQTRRLCN